MKVPNFASELDLIKQHLDAGDDVYVLQCQGELNSCLVNRQHWKSLCYQCKCRFDKGMALTGLAKAKLLSLSQQVDFSPLPEVFASLAELLRFTALGINLGEGVVASVAAELKDHKFSTQQHQALIRKKLEMSYLVATNIQYYLTTLRPDRVYLYNGRLAETKPVLNSCLNACIPAYVVERAGTQGKYELYQNTTPLDIEYWTQDFKRLWEENPTGNREALAKQFYEERRQAQDQGDRSFTKAQQADLLPEGFDPGKRNIAIFITSEFELSGYPARDNPLYTDQNDGIQKLSQTFQNDLNTVFWVRMHPNITFAKNTQLLELQEMDHLQLPNLKIIWPDSKVDTYALMESADVVLTFGSTVGVEATYWGRPSVLAGKAYYEHFDVCHIATTHQELVELLRQPPEVKNPMGALQYGHGLMTNGYPFQTFQQKELHGGTFLGVDLEPFTLFQKQKAYVLRKLDKVLNSL